jgi:hypothetical protein
VEEYRRSLSRTTVSFITHEGHSTSFKLLFRLLDPVAQTASSTTPRSVAVLASTMMRIGSSAFGKVVLRLGKLRQPGNVSNSLNDLV